MHRRVQPGCSVSAHAVDSPAGTWVHVTVQHASAVARSCGLSSLSCVAADVVTQAEAADESRDVLRNACSEPVTSRRRVRTHSSRSAGQTHPPSVSALIPSLPLLLLPIESVRGQLLSPNTEHLVSVPSPSASVPVMACFGYVRGCIRTLTPRLLRLQTQNGACQKLSS